jgi:2-methylcitrate dehydratase PrpD
MAHASNAQGSEFGTSLTRQLVERSRAIEYAGLPADVCELARQCVLDWIGVTLAASSDALPRLLIDEALADGGRPLSTVVGHSLRVSPLQAALINGAASHVLDYDDGNIIMIVHASAAILPGLLALGEMRSSNGAELVAAFIAGYEMGCRVALLVQPGHYARGYHNTCTIGTVAAATACAHLLKLDAQRMAHALGIAATQAAGLKSMFGTQCKPFHAGLAAHNGLRAARLAASGMTSRNDVLECPQGFALTLSPDFHPHAALAEPDKFYVRENLFKYHAACGGTHAAVECVHELRALYAFETGCIERVVVRAEPGADAMCNIAVPATGLEAKFSLRFMAAAALLGADTAALTLYEDANVREPSLCALRDKVRVEFVKGWPKLQCEVIIELDDGRKLRATHDAGKAPTDYIKQGQRLRAKFERLAEPIIGASQSRTIAKLVEVLDRTSVADLMAACAAPRRA